jgi:tetratricopeptide (TPR) repeat protein
MSRLQQLLQLKASSPQGAFIDFALAKEYEKLGDQQQARRYYEALVAEYPEEIGTYYHLGKLYERIQQPELAFATYKLGMQVAQKIGDKHSYSELAGAKLNLGDDDDFE